MGASVHFDIHPKYSPDNILYSFEHAHEVLMEEAFYEYGHRGYTGTIAEKPEFKVFTLKEEYRALPDKFFTNLNFRDADEYFIEPGACDIYYDKWGPSVAIETKDSYIFTGYASN